MEEREKWEEDGEEDRIKNEKRENCVSWVLWFEERGKKRRGGDEAEVYQKHWDTRIPRMELMPTASK